MDLVGRVVKASLMIKVVIRAETVGCFFRFNRFWH